MKKFFTFAFPILLLILLIVNVFIFMSGIQLSDDIGKFDRETALLKKENTELEKQVYEISSLQYAASASARLDFSQETKPIYLNNFGYALNRL